MMQWSDLEGLQIRPVFNVSFIVTISVLELRLT